jgi:hypothetical protein
MRELLCRAGFRVRSGTRADCAHCKGSSRGTVAYTDQVAYCHRCQWRANRVLLERELGLRPPKGNGQTRRSAPALAQKIAAEQRRQLEAELAAFDTWRNWKLREIAAGERYLHDLQFHVGNALAENRELDSLWEALDLVVGELRNLAAAWEFFWRDPVPQYREHQVSMADLVAAWRRDLAGKEATR